MPESNSSNQLTQLLEQLSREVQILDYEVQRLEIQQQQNENLLAPPIFVWCGSRTHSLTRLLRLPIMLYNSAASELAPIRYPAGVPGENLPQTRRELLNFTGKCSARNWSMRMLLILGDCQDLNFRLQQRCLDSLACPAIYPLTNLEHRLPHTLEPRIEALFGMKRS